MLITNARLVNEGTITEADLLIRNGRIQRIAPQITAPPGHAVHDAAGALLMPGMIDDQVHFREPGLTHKGDLATESRAAVAGGITSFMEMPNTRPQTSTREALAEKYRNASGRSAANYAFYMGATNDNLDEIKALRPGEACGVKVFMGASTGNMLVDAPKVLDGIFSSTPYLVATHCEDTPTIMANEAAWRKRYGDAIPITAHPKIRSHESCWLSSSMAVGLAKRHGTKLHVLHLTTAREMALFEPGPIESKQITAEACVHHLWFDESRYPDLGTRIKCNPSVKSAADREALVKAVREDRIDIIATDHAPHTAEEKANPSYFKAPAGLPLVEHALLVALGLAGALQHGAHVRIDILQRRWDATRRRRVDQLGVLLLALPFCAFVLWSCADYVAVAWQRREASAEPGGGGGGTATASGSRTSSSDGYAPGQDSQQLQETQQLPSLTAQETELVRLTKYTNRAVVDMLCGPRAPETQFTPDFRRLIDGQSLGQVVSRGYTQLVHPLVEDENGKLVPSARVVLLPTTAST